VLWDGNNSNNNKGVGLKPDDLNIVENKNIIINQLIGATDIKTPTNFIKSNTILSTKFNLIMIVISKNISNPDLKYTLDFYNSIFDQYGIKIVICITKTDLEPQIIEEGANLNFKKV
jgi:hypothetical protein